jgi:hypothetical protein
MPLETSHPFDDVLARKRPLDFPNKREARRVVADVSYIALKAAAYIGSIHLMTLGLPIVFFLAISHGSAELFFAHLANLADRFLAADPARQEAFANEVRFGLVGIATLIAIYRLPRFLRDVDAGLRREKS